MITEDEGVFFTEATKTSFKVDESIIDVTRKADDFTYYNAKKMIKLQIKWREDWCIYFSKINVSCRGYYYRDCGWCVTSTTSNKKNFVKMFWVYYKILFSRRLLILKKIERGVWLMISEYERKEEIE